MKKYHKVVVGLELNPKSDLQIIKKAKELKETYGATLELLHSIEHLSNYGAAFGVAAGVDVEGVLRKEAEKELAKIGKKLEVAEKNQHVILGPAKIAILDAAEKNKADLIVVGSHGRSGVRLLLGSTANAVLHSAKCDVLAVRVSE